MSQPIAESTTLLNANIGFLRTHLAIIHIPTSAYSLFLQPILALLLHNNTRDQHGAVVAPHRPWNYWLPFVNLSITPNECSIVCPREEAEALFQPLIASLSADLQTHVSISPEDYSAITIGGEGLDAGQRVLDLTSPLALAGIPIFFITSYYSDFILVPLSARLQVIHALEERGFVFEADSEDGEAGHMTNPASPLSPSHAARPGSCSSSSNSSGIYHHHHYHSLISSSMPPPNTPPTPTPPPTTTTISDLQLKTFQILARNHISPSVDTTLQLITCAGLKDSTPGSSTSNFTQGKLDVGIAKCLTTTQPWPPKFFSLTLTDSESASFTLEKRLLANFPNRGQDILLGTLSPEQIPITLDLQTLPVESTGIVCGVSSRLTEGMKGRLGREMFNMSYLSTSRAGHVIVYEDELEDAMDALRGAEMLHWGKEENGEG